MKTKWLKAFYIILPFFCLAGALTVKANLSFFLRLLPQCPFNTVTGLYCPGCGITRSITALLQGDPLAALRYNAAPFVLGLLLVFLYIEWGTDLFGTHRRLLPQQPVFWVVLGGVFGIYWVLRNFFPLG